jgi:hypothetical protein
MAVAVHDLGYARLRRRPFDVAAANQEGRSAG